MPLLLEVIATSVDDALAIDAGGAARIELVAALDRGGLTPPLAMVDAVLARVRIPCRIMIREGESHEVLDAGLRRRLVELARQIGQRPIDGIVFGALRQGSIDATLLAEVGDAANRPITFHRAFEAVVDPEAALGVLRRDSRVDRVLCDGGPGDWTARAARLAAWSRASAGRLRLLAGGGITADAIEALAARPEIGEVHVGRLVRSPPTPEGVVSAELVRQLVSRLEQAGPGG